MTVAIERLVDAGVARPTRVRYRVVSLAVLLAMVTYLDRACISVVAPNIMHDLSLTKAQMGYVFSAFALAYAIFEIPTAWWADRVGTRTVLTRIVVWWSCFTVATAGAFNYVSLVITRFLFGMGEAGAWPSVASTFSRWIPRRERGTVQGIFFVGAHLGGGVTPMVVMALLKVISWRVVFVLFGLVGFLWATVWYRWFRNDPAEHAQVNAAELDYIVAGRQAGGGHHASWAYWRRLFGHRNTLPLCLMYFPNSYAFYFCITWLPTYLSERHGFTAASLGILAGMPLILSVLGDLCGGLATDWVTARFGLRVGRAGVGAVAYILAGLAMLLAGLSTHGIVAAVLIAVATAASMFTLGAAWGTCIDIGGNHAGVVSAAMNTSGQISSILSPIVVVYLLKWYADWSLPLYLMGILFLVGALGWAFIDPRKQIFD
jgi:MFS transporter, ACS family, glucarate transporter